MALALRVNRLSLPIRALPLHTLLLVLQLQGLEPPLQLLLVLKVQGLILRAQHGTLALQVSRHLLLGLQKVGLLRLDRCGLLPPVARLLKASLQVVDLTFVLASPLTPFVHLCQGH